MGYARLFGAFRFALPPPAVAIDDARLRQELELPAGTGLVALAEVQLRSERLAQLWSAAREKPPAARSDFDRAVLGAAAAFAAQSNPARGLPPAIIPLSGHSGGSWVGPADVAASAAPAFSAELAALRELAAAYRAGDRSAFDIAARTFREAATKKASNPQELRFLDREVKLNALDPFYRAEMFYGFSFLLMMASLIAGGRWFRHGALALVIIGFLFHSYGLLERMFIMGRPPATNLYATFLFVAWCGVLLALLLEFFIRNRLGLLIAGAAGLALLLVAGRFTTDGDTMGVVVAVLDSNFWLATHVITISIGYAGCVISGLLGHIYLLQALSRRTSDAALRETFAAVYGTQAFGLIFSFLGTMLGGIWADQSWGRFWGWDPKENGALVIVLWSAIIFHARLGRVIGPRGFAAGSVIGVVFVFLAWLGVNLLSVGLHSYGFTSGIARGLFIACAIEILFVLAVTPFARRAFLPAAPDGSKSAFPT
jgi:ABC-type transport system involved in cytochrome c biogenesis permease subunit